VANASKLSDSALEILYIWAIVCKPIAIKHVIDSLLETFPASNIWSANVNLFGKRGKISEDGEVLKLNSLFSVGHQAHIVLYTTALMPVKNSNADVAGAFEPSGSGATKLLIIGSSGHAAVLVDAIQVSGSYRIAGYLDDTMAPGTVRRGYPILGAIENVTAVCDEHGIADAVIAIGDNWWRRHVHEKLIKWFPPLKFPVVLHPSAVVSKSAEIGRGTAVLATCHIGPRSKVGAFCILNTGSSIDHDCEMHDYSSIGPGVFTGGLVEIGECSAIGVGASISDRISVGRHAVIGTGAVVVRNIPDLAVAYGNPARVRRSRSEGESYVDSNKSSL
jgi:sugar O-acyltransferase (sialic acid O-acetyltransferase NeuD family)